MNVQAQREALAKELEQHKRVVETAEVGEWFDVRGTREFRWHHKNTLITASLHAFKRYNLLLMHYK